MNSRVKAMIVGLSSALAVAVVALALVSLRPQPKAATPVADATKVADTGQAGGAQDRAGDVVAVAASPVKSEPTSDASSGNTSHDNGGKTDGTTTTTTTQPPAGGGNGGNGGGGKHPRPPFDDVLGDHPIVLDPGLGSATTTTTTPPKPPKFPCKTIKTVDTCPDLPF